MCFSKRKTATNCIAVIAALSLIGGILMIGFTVQLVDMKVLTELSEVDDFDRFDEVRSVFFFILLIIAILTILLSICGLFCRCLKNRCWTIWYGVFLFPSFLILIVFGGVFIAFSVWGKDKIE